MKIKRIKLVTLLDKQDCKEFDNHIIELLKEQYSEEEIDISPNGLPPGGTNLYYWLEDNTKAWRADDHTSFPVQSVKDFLNEPIKITDVKQLKVGDRIKILEKPESWASVLNKNCPMKLEFPFTATIKAITQDIITTYMTCGSYGWSLDAIVEAGCLLLPEGRFYNFACGITEEETWDNTLHGRKGILKYHYDWNGIMKIVEKINSISICKNTSDTTLLTIRTDLRAHLNVCNKEGVIQNIHKFIKLYNEINKNV